MRPVGVGDLVHVGDYRVGVVLETPGGFVDADGFDVYVVMRGARARPYFVHWDRNKAYLALQSFAGPVTLTK